MAKITYPGNKHKRTHADAWYCVVAQRCPRCDATFLLEPFDFEQKDGPAMLDPYWKIVATARTPGGVQIIEGPCPDCGEYIRLEGRNGSPLR